MINLASLLAGVGMRAFRIVLIGLVPIILPTYSFAQISLTKGQVADWVKEYVRVSRNSQRSTELRKALEGVQKKVVEKQVIKYVHNRETRDRSIELAVELELPGIFSKAKSYLISKNLENLILLSIVTDDPEAQEYVFKRWKTLDSASTECQIIESLFLKHRLRFETVGLFVDYLNQPPGEKGTKKQYFAIKISYLGMKLKTDNIGKIVRSYKVQRAEWDVFAKELRVRGYDLFENHKPFLSNATRFGRNYRLSNSGQARFETLPKFVQTGDHTFRMWVYVVTKSDYLSVWLGSEQGSWQPRIVGNCWVVKTGGAVSYGSAPVMKDGWNEIVFELKDVSAGGRMFDRRIEVIINRIKLRINGSLNGKLTTFGAQSGKGTIVVGGYEITSK